MESDKRFPFLSPEERKIVFSFEADKSTEARVVELMLRFSEDFRSAESAAQRIKARAKLLGLAGLYEIIPVERFEAARNTPLSLTLLELKIEGDEDPLRALIKCGEVPFDLIVNFPGLKEFFDIKLPDGATYQERLLEKHNEIGGVLVILKSDMNEEVVGNVSASSEPLTRSIILNPWAEDSKQQMRDFASMAYDLIMQIEFLAIFYRSRQTLNRSAIQASMRLEGLGFVLDVFSCLLKRAVEGGHLEIEIGAEEVLLRHNEGDESLELCNYLKYLLYGLAMNTINQLNQVLGAELAEVEIARVMGKHQIDFDPRKMDMRIV